MSTPDDPTRRIPPTEPPLPAVREREYAVADGEPWRQSVLDRLDSLRTWVVAAVVLSLLAIGLAGYTLLTAEEEDDARAGASREQVNDLSERVDELASDVGDAPSEKAVRDVREGQQELGDRVKALEDAAEESASDDGGTEELQSAVDDLNDSMTQLDQRVSDLEQRMDEQEQQQP